MSQSDGSMPTAHLRDDGPLIDRQSRRRLTQEIGVDRAARAFDLFGAEMRRRVPILTQALGEGDLGVLGTLMHSVKGSALTFGAPLLAATARRADEACRAGDRPAAYESGHRVLELLAATLVALDGGGEG